MPLVDVHTAFVTFGDSRKDHSTISVRVTAAEANAYFEAVSQILKDATNVGQLLLSFEDLSAGSMIAKGVALRTYDDAVVYPTPDANIYNFDKLMIHYAAGGFNYHVTIPSRDDTVYLVSTDGVTVRLDSPAAVTQLVTRFNALVLSKYGDDATLTEIQVSS